MKYEPQLYVKAKNSVYRFGIDSDLEMTFDDFKQPQIII